VTQCGRAARGKGKKGKGERVEIQTPAPSQNFLLKKQEVEALLHGEAKVKRERED